MSGENTGFTGGCLCGAVKYESKSPPAVCGKCHCDDCRRASGAGHCAHIGVPEGAFTVSGTVKGFAKPADSGNMVVRNFCPECGSAVYSTNSGMENMVFIRASSLDDLEVFQPQMTVYAARAASWDKVTEGLPAFDGMPEELPAAVQV